MNTISNFLLRFDFLSSFVKTEKFINLLPYINLQIPDKSDKWCSLRKTPFNFIPKMKNIYRQVNVQKPHFIYKPHDFFSLCPHPHTLITTNHDVNSSGKV